MFLIELIPARKERQTNESRREERKKKFVRFIETMSWMHFECGLLKSKTVFSRCIVSLCSRAIFLCFNLFIAIHLIYFPQRKIQFAATNRCHALDHVRTIQLSTDEANGERRRSREKTFRQSTAVSSGEVKIKTISHKCVACNRWPLFSHQHSMCAWVLCPVLRLVELNRRRRHRRLRASSKWNNRIISIE